MRPGLLDGGVQIRLVSQPRGLVILAALVNDSKEIIFGRSIVRQHDVDFVNLQRCRIVRIVYANHKLSFNAVAFFHLLINLAFPSDFSSAYIPWA